MSSEHDRLDDGGAAVYPSDLADLTASHGRVLARLLNRLQEEMS